MPGVQTIFRRCPSCGKRFEIRITGKELVKEELVQEALKVPSGIPPKAALLSSSVLPLAEDKPVLVDVKDFRYSYLCKHCGHKWTEIREEEGGPLTLKGK